MSSRQNSTIRTGSGITLKPKTDKTSEKSEGSGNAQKGAATAQKSQTTAPAAKTPQQPKNAAAASSTKPPASKPPPAAQRPAQKRAAAVRLLEPETNALVNEKYISKEEELFPLRKAVMSIIQGDFGQTQNSGISSPMSKNAVVAGFDQKVNEALSALDEYEFRVLEHIKATYGSEVDLANHTKATEKAVTGLMGDMAITFKNKETKKETAFKIPAVWHSCVVNKTAESIMQVADLWQRAWVEACFGRESSKTQTTSESNDAKRRKIDEEGGLAPKEETSTPTLAMAPDSEIKLPPLPDVKKIVFPDLPFENVLETAHQSKIQALTEELKRSLKTKIQCYEEETFRRHVATTKRPRTLIADDIKRVQEDVSSLSLAQKRHQEQDALTSVSLQSILEQLKVLGKEVTDFETL